MSDDFDASEAAAVATGDASPSTSTGASETSDSGGGETTENHAAAEGAPSESDVGSESTIREMLMSTGPEKPLSKVESPWKPDEGGLSRMYRGIQKMTDVDGMPAMVDLIVGAVEAAHRFNDGLRPDGSSDGGEQADEPGDGDGAEIDGGVPSA